MKAIIHRLTLLITSVLLSFPSMAELVILQYHHVATNTPAVSSISPQGFAEHMDLLEKENMVVVDLYEAMQALDRGETLPDRAVVITFDDAYLSVYENALPILAKRKWPFTMFVNTAAVDGNHNVAMSWDQLRDMQRQGGVLANHSVNHPYLIERPETLSIEQWLDQEIGHAQRRLEKELGISIRMHAYPYGEFNQDIIDWMDSNGYLAFGQQSGAVSRHSHRQALPRYPASGIYANPKTLVTKLHSLAFPIKADQLIEPILHDNPPTLSFAFSSDDIRPHQIQCFAGGQGAISTKATRQDGVITVEAKADNPITAGRPRYNCTAPSIQQPSRYYWYSQFWTNTDIPNR